MLSAVWVWRGWGDLSALRLPDTDDAMRLQQIRDWLGGQAFSDLSQHRLAGGLAMHWSRLPDLVPGGLIALLTPVAGRHAAELTAVIVWPAALFAAALFLTGRVARAVGAWAGTGMPVAAIGYPATGLFLPGRIDHHALQLVLLLGILLALLLPPSRGRSAAAGGAAAMSLIVGLETAPLIAVLFAVAAVEWSGICAIPGLSVLPPAREHEKGSERGEDRRIDGLAGGFAGGLAVAFVLFRPQAFGWPGCDGFTATAFRAEAVAGVALAVLALAGRTRLPRLPALGGVALAAGVAVVLVARACLDPYGGVDPWLAGVWLSRVAEAQPLFAASPGLAVAQGGLAVVGLAATAWQAWRTRDRDWMILLAVQGAAVLLACVQLRAVNAAALLAAPGLAAMIGVARARGTVALAAAWLASAGIVYPLAARAIGDKPAAGGGSAADCRSAEGLLAQLPPGALVIAPPDVGAYGIAGSRLRFLAAPYHRNNAGNLAPYRFFLSDEARARRIAARAGADYVIWCGDLGGVALPPESVAARIGRGDPPAWLHGQGAIFRVSRAQAAR